MTAATLTLTDFLLARIVEDERKWQATSMSNYTTHDAGCDFPGDVPGVCTCRLVQRLIAECEAKREVITTAAMYGGENTEVYAAFLSANAAVYADHPDYRDEWKP